MKQLMSSCRRCLNPWILCAISIATVGLIFFIPIIGITALIAALPLIGCTVMCGAMAFFMGKKK